MGRLMELVSKLRSESGCLWDRQQRKADIARYLLEESFEVVDAIEKGTVSDLREELGDLLFQIVFLVSLSQERGEFLLEDVLNQIEEKMIRRHPHVFGDMSLENVAAIKANWDAVKKTEGKGKGTAQELFAEIPAALPALLKAQKIGRVASRLGFDWSESGEVVKKVDEEMAELKDAIIHQHYDSIEEEMGDVLFSLVNLCRFLDLDAETSLREAINKFTRRIELIEEGLQNSGVTFHSLSASELDRLWESQKLKEEPK